MNHSVTIRPLRVDDAPAMVMVLSSPELYRYTGGTPPTEEQLTETYARQIVGFSPDRSQEWLNWIVLDLEQHPVGYVQATLDVGTDAAEIAWVIGVPWQGRGYATSAVQLMLTDLAARGVTTIVADIHPDNVPSQGVAKRIGMQPTSQVIDGEVRWTGKVARL